MSKISKFFKKSFFKFNGLPSLAAEARGQEAQDLIEAARRGGGDVVVNGKKYTIVAPSHHPKTVEEEKMDKDKQDKLEKAGWKVGSAEDFLDAKRPFTGHHGGVQKHEFAHEAMDRTFMMSQHLDMALEFHVEALGEDNVKEAYERAGDALAELYQQLGTLMFELDEEREKNEKETI